MIVKAAAILVAAIGLLGAQPQQIRNWVFEKLPFPEGEAIDPYWGMGIISCRKVCLVGFSRSDGTALLYLLDPQSRRFTKVAEAGGGVSVDDQGNSVVVFPGSRFVLYSNLEPKTILTEGQLVPGIGRVDNVGGGIITPNGEKVLFDATTRAARVVFAYDVISEGFPVLARDSFQFLRQGLSGQKVFGIQSTPELGPRIAEIDWLTGSISILTGQTIRIEGQTYTISRGLGGMANPRGLVFWGMKSDTEGDILFCDHAGSCRKLVGLTPGYPTSLLWPGTGLAVDEDGNVLFNAHEMLPIPPSPWGTDDVSRNLFLLMGDTGVVEPVMLHNDHLWSTQAGTRYLGSSDGVLMKDPEGRLVVLFVHQTDSGNALVLGTRVNSPAPQILSVVNGASFLEGSRSPREHFTIFGKDLTAGQVAVASTEATFTLAGASVAVCGHPARMIYASPGQINAIWPSLTRAGDQCEVKVTTPSGSNVLATTVPTAQFSWAIFMWQPTGPTGSLAWPKLVPVVTRTIGQDWRLVGPPMPEFEGVVVPAVRGEYITLWATGCGISHPDEQNTPPSGIRLDNPPVITIGGKSAYVDWAGLAPGWVGLCQVNLIVPTDSPSGVVEMEIQGAPKYELYVQ